MSNGVQYLLIICNGFWLLLFAKHATLSKGSVMMPMRSNPCLR